MIEQILAADRLIQVDQVDAARQIYQGVVDLDPHNAIAVVGLAQCALADGDEQRAHGLAAQALAIDPENDMARRMEARLAEIMAMRGEPVKRPDAVPRPATRELRPIIGEPSPAAAASSPGSPTSAALPSDRAPTGDDEPSSDTRPAMHKSFLDRLLGR